MGKQRLNDLNMVPPRIFDWQTRGFAYVQSELGEPAGRVEASSWKELLFNIKQRRASNNIPVGLMFEDEINEWIAERVPQNFTALPNGTPNIQINRTEWPMWAKAIALLKADGDEGVGDTIYRTIGPTNSETFKSWYKTLFGSACGCSERRETFNRLYTYD